MNPPHVGDILGASTTIYSVDSRCLLIVKLSNLSPEFNSIFIIILYWNVPCWGHQLWGINCCMCVCVCVSVSQCICPPTYRYIAPRMIQRITLKLCGYVGCDDATNVSNFGYEPIKFSSLKLIK